MILLHRLRRFYTQQEVPYAGSPGETVNTIYHPQLAVNAVWSDIASPYASSTCSNASVTKYQKRISGPLLDRIDIHVEVPRVAYEKLSDSRLGEPSAVIRERVEAARQIQRERFAAGATHFASAAHLATCNADMRPAEVRQHCQLDDTGRSLMRSAMNQLNLSARAYHRVLKLARTIADLAGSENIGPAHLAEALQYRPKMEMG